MFLVAHKWILCYGSSSSSMDSTTVPYTPKWAHRAHCVVASAAEWPHKKKNFLSPPSIGSTGQATILGYPLDRAYHSFQSPDVALTILSPKIAFLASRTHVVDIEKQIVNIQSLCLRNLQNTMHTWNPSFAFLCGVRKKIMPSSCFEGNYN